MIQTTRLLSCFFVIGGAMLASGCLRIEGEDEGIDPRWTGLIPDEALTISTEEFEKLEAQGDIRLIDKGAYVAYEARMKAPAEPAEDEAADIDADTKSKVDSMLASYKDLPRARLERLIAKPSDDATATRRLLSRKLFSGDTSFSGKVMPHKAHLLHLVQAHMEVNSDGNGAKAFRLLYERLPDDLKRGFAQRPEQVDLLPNAEALQASQQLASYMIRNSAMIKRQRSTSKSAGTSRQTIDCTGDEDYAMSIHSDSYNNAKRYNAYSAIGLMHNFDFPVKSNLTCVKDQYSRGTCVSFAAAGALEVEIATQTGRFVNLSEQDLYSHAKNIWRVEENSDGTWGDLVWSNLDPSGKAYFMPKEQSWAYNPSVARVGLGKDGSGPYEHSCDSYPTNPAVTACAGLSDVDAATCTSLLARSAIHCSDTAGQARLKCADGFVSEDGSTYKKCGFAGPLRTGEGFRISGKVQLWDGSDVDSSMDRLIATLQSGKAVFLETAVPNSIFVPVAGGYIAYDAPEETDGGHALLAVGYVSNEEIEDKLGREARLAEGSGYLIVKNSWGPGYADGGYMYVPTDWFKDYGGAASVLMGSVESKML